MGVLDRIRRVFSDSTPGKPSFAGTPYPTGGVDKTDQLQQELGGTGTYNFGGFIRGEDFNPQMDAQTAIKNLDEMRRSDAQAHAALEVVKMPIRTADYEVDPADPDDPESVKQAEFVRWCLFSGMSTTWDDVVRQALLMLDFGFMLFEKVWAVQEDGEWKDHIVLKRLAPRPPKTLWQWFTDEDGALISIKQLAVKAGTYQFLDIPASKLVRFTFQQEGDNFQGISMLRTAYPHWLIKKQLYVIDAIRATRFGVGIPRAKLKEGYKPTSEDRSAIAIMLQGLSSHQHAYLIQPPQLEVDILMPQGVQGGAQLLPSINHQNEQITRNILAQFLDMGGKGSGGSRALGGSAMDFFLNAIESIADQFCDVMNKQVIKDLIDMNYDSGGKYPTLRPVGIQETDIKSLAMAAQSLAAAGLLTADKKTENTFRNLMNLPEVPDEDDGLDPSVAGVQPQVPGQLSPGIGSAPSGASGQTPLQRNGSPQTAKKKAVPATSAHVPAKPATAATAPAAPATAATVPAATTATQPATATPATAEASEAILRPGAQAPPVEASTPDIQPAPPTRSAPPLINTVADGGVAGRPKAVPADGQPAESHEPARTTAYQTMPANTTWQTAQPAVSAVRDPMPAKTSTTIPTTAHMARSTTAPSGDADGEGHPQIVATPATSQRRAAVPATDQATHAIHAAETAQHTHQTVRALSGRRKSDRSPDRWTMEDGVTTLWRQPTTLETQVLDLHEVPHRLNTARTALLGTLRGVREEQILRIASAVAHTDPAKLPTLKPPLVGKMAADILKAMQDMYRYGYGNVTTELTKQRVAGKRRFGELSWAFEKISDLFALNAILDSAETPGEKLRQLNSALDFLRDHLGTRSNNDDESTPDPAVAKLHSLYDKYDLIKTLKVKQFDDAVRDLARDAQSLGSDISISDIGKFAAKKGEKAVEQLAASARMSSQSTADKTLAQARGEALRLQRAGWEPDEIEDALKIHMGQMSDADISRIASQETNEAFSLGRMAAAAEFKDQIQVAVYSAILDNNVCPICEDLDGEEFDVDSDEYEEHMPPNANCEGGDQCRCTYIYILDPNAHDADKKDESELSERRFGGPGSGPHPGMGRKTGNQTVHGQYGTGKFATSAGMTGMAGMMANIAKPDGGFTYHAVTGHQPTTGYALSIYKGHEKVLDAKTMVPKDLVRFATDNRDLLSQKDNFFGAWHNPADGKVYLDISKVVGSAHQAEKLGRANKQLAYFDLAGGKSVDIGGQQHRERGTLAVVGKNGTETTSLHDGSKKRWAVVRRPHGAVPSGVRTGTDAGRSGGREEGIRREGEVAFEEDFDESKHPRDAHGRFGAGAVDSKAEKEDHGFDSSLKSAEDEIRGEPLEHAVILREDGSRVATLTSNASDHVDFGEVKPDDLKNTVLTHNHPLGYGLSTDDANAAVVNNMAEIRAVTKDNGTFSFRRLGDTWVPGTVKAVFDKSDEVHKEFSEKISNKLMTVSEANMKHFDEVYRRAANWINKDATKPQVEYRHIQ